MIDPNSDSPLRRKHLDASNINRSTYEKDNYQPTTAKEWEESLEEIVSLTNDNLIALERAKICAKSSESANTIDQVDFLNGRTNSRMMGNNSNVHHKNNESIPINNISSKLSCSRPRAMSASKANYNNSSSNNNSGNPNKTTTQSFDLWTTIPKNEFGIEKKVDLLFKKYKVMEDKVKKNEKDNSILQQIVNDNRVIIEKLSETNKNDKRVIYNMKEQFSNLKSRLETILNNEEIKERFTLPSHHYNNTIDKELITELVSQRVKDEIPKVVSEISKDIMKLFTKLSDKINLDYRINTNKRFV